jgi:hypothetical protein
MKQSTALFPALSSRRLARRALGGLALAAVALSLGGCSLFQKKGEQMDCPEIRVDADTAKLTQFRQGGGQDITDIVIESQIASLDGDCGWDAKSRTLDVKLKVLFQVTRGPAMDGREGNLTYFVAIPAFYPAAGAKQIMPVKFAFPEGNVNSMMIRDEEVHITLPLGEEKTSKDVPLYVGFQLTQQELTFNRKGR